VDAGSRPPGPYQGRLSHALGPRPQSALHEQQLGSIWTSIAGSLRTSVIIHDGVSLYASYGGAYGGNPVYSAKLSDTTKWTNMTHPGRGANQMAYDSAHHTVYEADWANGLWRLVTR
jgi:hypothetical protein